MDSALIPEGAKRCSFPKFMVGMALVGAVLLWGVYAMFLCWFKGLNQTNMNDYYGFALWIWADLAVIAVGGGAFFTGLLKYIFKVDELKNIINFAVIIGFICYSSALLILAIDIGQPLRGWFIFWHANVHSMLTEVAFCLSLYLSVLAVEFLPLILENRQIDKNPFAHNLSHNMHEAMAVFAATGAFLSCFHQGSLGGTTGVLYGRPFVMRDGIFIWPWSFFLYTWSAAACGPCFTMLCTKITEMMSGKKLVKDNVYDLLAKISGWMLGTYMVAKILDTLWWAMVTLPRTGFRFSEFFTASGTYHGFWILILEFACGIIPAAILMKKAWRQNSRLFMTAIVLATIGICLNRWVMVLQPMAMPVMSFDKWVLYLPSWQEVATTILPVAGSVMIVALSYRYLPVFPQEKELNPVEKS
ncbi:MAG: polysulfide reductase NrfD [Desulfobacterales bacterium]|nr:polysulfide reductase NrfD [Desulfobacterales bacterium]